MSVEDSFEYVTVRIGDQLFGVEVKQIREVFSPQDVTSVPRAPGEIAGLLNLRGRIVTAVDARHRLGLPPRDPDAAVMALGLEEGTELFGVLVDQVGVACHTGRRSCFFRAVRGGRIETIAQVEVDPEKLYGGKT